MARLVGVTLAIVREHQRVWQADDRRGSGLRRQPLVLKRKSPGSKPSTRLSTTCDTVRPWQTSPGASRPPRRRPH